ncbi:putative GPI-anchored protein At4g28100 [Bidens hawaiensis]|uniref:putative GPI-anchored protein At4g28100 n=1 Tax=Bidens hawaiensis TaxID=980011 RepID=UPI0040498D23
MNYLPLLLFSSLILLPILPALPVTEPSQQPFIPNPSPPGTTIPAFPEQADDSGCPLDLPTDLFKNVKSACTGKHGSGELRRSRCCPVLAAWLYSAYATTALRNTLKQTQQTMSYYDLPLLPNDSETCIDSLDNRLRSHGIELRRVNESCDVVYCECGVRLHQLSCPEAFTVNSVGDLVGNNVVRKLEKDCLNNVAVNGFPGLNGCSKCLKTLHLLNKGDKNKSEERSNKMHNEDCELMGLTWLLAKNRSAYIHTVSAVLRATMDSNTNSESCTLNSDGMPLAVDSYEINGSPSTSTRFNSPLTLCLLLILMLYVSFHQVFDSM